MAEVKDEFWYVDEKNQLVKVIYNDVGEPTYYEVGKIVSKFSLKKKSKDHVQVTVSEQGSNSTVTLPAFAFASDEQIPDDHHEPFFKAMNSYANKDPNQRNLGGVNKSLKLEDVAKTAEIEQKTLAETEELEEDESDSDNTGGKKRKKKKTAKKKKGKKEKAASDDEEEAESHVSVEGEEGEGEGEAGEQEEEEEEEGEEEEEQEQRKPKKKPRKEKDELHANKRSKAAGAPPPVVPSILIPSPKLPKMALDMSPSPASS